MSDFTIGYICGMVIAVVIMFITFASKARKERKKSQPLKSAVSDVIFDILKIGAHVKEVKQTEDGVYIAAGIDDKTDYEIEISEKGE